MNKIHREDQQIESTRKVTFVPSSFPFATIGSWFLITVQNVEFIFDIGRHHLHFLVSQKYITSFTLILSRLAGRLC
jgi:hypothetical protein